MKQENLIEYYLELYGDCILKPCYREDCMHYRMGSIRAMPMFGSRAFMCFQCQHFHRQKRNYRNKNDLQIRYEEYLRKNPPKKITLYERIKTWF